MFRYLPSKRHLCVCVRVSVSWNWPLAIHHRVIYSSPSWHSTTPNGSVRAFNSVLAANKLLVESTHLGNEFPRSCSQQENDQENEIENSKKEIPWRQKKSVNLDRLKILHSTIFGLCASKVSNFSKKSTLVLSWAHTTSLWQLCQNQPNAGGKETWHGGHRKWEHFQRHAFQNSHGWQSRVMQ